MRREKVEKAWNEIRMTEDTQVSLTQNLFHLEKRFCISLQVHSLVVVGLDELEFRLELKFSLR